MRYFKNNELAKIFGVSKATITNWIESAKQNKIHLKLITENNKSFILNTQENLAEIENLSSKRKKYKNSRFKVSITPLKAFYETYNEKEIIEIINTLEMEKEINLRFAYYGKGAYQWDSYEQSAFYQSVNNYKADMIRLLDSNKFYIEDNLKDGQQINIIDIGPGNANPSKLFVENLYNKGLLNEYIGIDSSKEILKIAEENLRKNIGEKFPFKSYIKDFNKNQLRYILMKSLWNKNIGFENVNVILFLGSTIANQKYYNESLVNIRNSMSKSDLFILNQRIDTERARFHLNFDTIDEANKNNDLAQRKMVLDLLNIKEEYYDVERYYDEKERSRFIKIIFKVDININIETENIKKTIQINNKDKIIIWRNKHMTGPEIVNELTNVGFDVMHTSIAPNKEQILIISKVKV